MGLQTILHRQNHFCQSAAICLLFQYFTKMSIYVVRTGMSMLKMLCLTGCINRKVALRKETSALFVLEVCLFQYHIGTESRFPLSTVRVLYPQSCFEKRNHIFICASGMLLCCVCRSPIENKVQQTDVNVHI